MTRTGTQDVAMNESVMTKDKRRKSGTARRKKQKRVSKYELQFKQSGKAKYTALDRVGHLNVLDL